MSLKTESQKQHWVTPSLLFPKAQATFPTPPTSRDVLLHRALRRGEGCLLSPFLMILAHGVILAAFCMVLFSCGTMSMQVLHPALQKEGIESDGVVKIWCSNWFGSCLPELRSACVSSLAGWVLGAAVVHSGPPYIFRRMFLECLTEHNWAVCWLVAFP